MLESNGNTFPTAWFREPPKKRMEIFREIFAGDRLLDIQQVATPAMTAMLVHYDREVSHAGVWFSDKVHLFDFSLSQRVRGSKGYIGPSAPEYRRLGKVLFAPAGHLYRAEAVPGRQKSLRLFVHLGSEHGDELEFGRDLAPVLQSCLDLKSRNLQLLLSRILGEVETPGFASNTMLEGLGLTLLVEAARFLRLQDRDTKKAGGLPRWRLKAIEDRIRSGERSPSLSELAELCHLSTRHLIRAFRVETGETLSSFIQRLTIERAQDLLKFSDLPISTIAADVGFSSSAAFSVAFRRELGQSPREFRGAVGQRLM